MDILTLFCYFQLKICKHQHFLSISNEFSKSLTFSTIPNSMYEIRNIFYHFQLCLKSVTFFAIPNSMNEIHIFYCFQLDVRNLWHFLSFSNLCLKSVAFSTILNSMFEICTIFCHLQLYVWNLLHFLSSSTLCIKTLSVSVKVCLLLPCLQF